MKIFCKFTDYHIENEGDFVVPLMLTPVLNTKLITWWRKDIKQKNIPPLAQKLPLEF